MTDGRIIVINPNSTVAVTAGIDAALEGLRMAGAPEIECLTLAEGPPGIESQRHVDEVVMPLCRLAEAQASRAAAFVVACFSDPGVRTLRETLGTPVLGIAESGLLTALTLGRGVGVIAILDKSIPRHERFYRTLGIEGRIAGELALGLGVVELLDEAKTFGRMTAVGRRLRDEAGAEVLVLGCAGMARYRERLEEALDLPVVDPTQAAVGMAITAVRLGYGGWAAGPGGKAAQAMGRA